MSKTLNLLDIFSEKDIDRAIELDDADMIVEELVQPKMDEINKLTGQENLPKYIAYALLAAGYRSGKRDLP